MAPVQAEPRLLAAGLKKLLRALDGFAPLDAFVDAHAPSFASYTSQAEHQLEWTRIHAEYVNLLQGRIAEELGAMGCTEEAFFEYALACQASQPDAASDRLIARLLALSDYLRFCEMMCEAHALNEEFGPSRIAAESSDSDESD
ncbi:MAG: hypothetical protein SGPRY_000079 [Prymnesium sp.]